MSLKDQLVPVESVALAEDLLLRQGLQPLTTEQRSLFVSIIQRLSLDSETFRDSPLNRSRMQITHAVVLELSRPDLSSAEKEKLFIMLMDTYLRNQEQAKTSRFNFPSGLMGSLILIGHPELQSYFFPNSTNPLEEYWSSPEELQKYEDEIVQFMMQHYQQNNIVDLGFSDEGSFATAVRYSLQLGQYPRTLIRFEAAALDKTIFLPGSYVSEKTVYHEMLHAKNAGFMLGSLGTGLDEATTEHLAKQAYPPGNRLSEWLDRGYSKEVTFLRHLFQKWPELEDVFYQRYEQLTPKTVRAFYQAVTNIFGTEGLLLLYRMQPYAKKYQKQNKNSYALSAPEVMSRLESLWQSRQSTEDYS